MLLLFMSRIMSVGLGDYSIQTTFQGVTDRNLRLE